MPETYYSIWEVSSDGGMFRSLSTPREIEGRNSFGTHPEAVKVLRAAISVRLSGRQYVCGRRHFEVQKGSRWTPVERAVDRFAKCISDVARRQIHQMAMNGQIIAR